MNAAAMADGDLGRARRLGIALAAAAALALSLLLLQQSLAGGAAWSLPGCGGATESSALDCDHVLRSRWATWLGLPVSGLAAASYVVLLAALLHSNAPDPRRRRLARGLLTVTAVMVLGAAAWFVSLQAAEGKYCLYCMAAHSLGLLAAGLILTVPQPGARRVALTAAGILGVAALVGGQLLLPPSQAQVQHASPGARPDFDTGPGPDRQISILAGRVALRPHQFPMLGSPDAPHVMVYLFDYTCPYCRVLHGQLEEVRTRFQGQLAVVLLPVPMHPACNPVAKSVLPQHEEACELATLAMAVWRARPQAFDAFHRWLVEGDTPPTAAAARVQALTLLDSAALDAALADPWVRDQIQRNITLHQLSNAQVVPALIIRHVMLLARPTQEELLGVLADDLGLTPGR